MSKNEFFKSVEQTICIWITAIICYCIYTFENIHPNALFAISLGVVAYLLICFYNIIYQHLRQGMATKIISALTVLAFANHLYDYNTLVSLLPFLGNFDPIVITFIILGSVLSVLLIVRLILYLYRCTDNTSNEVTPNVTELTSNKPKKKKTGVLVYYFAFTFIFISIISLLFFLIYNQNVINENLDFIKLFSLSIKYTGLITLIILTIVFVTIFMIEMIRLIIFRVKAFNESIKNKESNDSFPLYAFSAMLDVLVCYLVYKFSGITMDTFYDFVHDGRYLALPLLVLFIGIAFVIFLRLTHATLILLIDMKPDDVKKFFKNVNNKTKISERIVEIVRILIDLVLNSLLTALKFVSFIPSFFSTLYSFVFEEENTYNSDLSENACSSPSTEEHNKT